MKVKILFTTISLKQEGADHGSQDEDSEEGERKNTKCLKWVNV